jgi:GNAT superfamily N-acetyltransferase
VGSMRSGDVGSVLNLYVRTEHRRKGIGTALMTTLLADDRRNRIVASTLLASHTGAKLYPRVGYRPIATLYLFGGKRG